MAEHSAIIVDGIQRGTLQRCPHCSGHFLVAAHGTLAEGRSALGKLAHPRVFCVKCGRLTCGRPECDPSLGCVPYEALLDHAEGKTTRYDDIIRERRIII